MFQCNSVQIAMHVPNATLRKDDIDNSNKLQVKFCHTLHSNMAS